MCPNLSKTKLKSSKNELKIDEKNASAKTLTKKRKCKGTTQENFEQTYDAQKLDAHKTL